MANRNMRWLALTVFALANLVCWAGIAAAVGLIVSPSVDLGMERLLREGQATAAAMWDQLHEQRSNPTATTEGTAPTQTPAGTETTSEEPIAATPLPGSPAPPTTPQPDSTRQAEANSSADSAPTAAPDSTLETAPLLLANPEFSNLALIDAEMARSAPLRPVQIRYHEDTLNAEIAALWRNNPDLPYRDVRVDLMRDQVVVTGRVSVLGFGVNAEITGDVLVRDCVPVLQIGQLRIAGVMTPKFVRDQVESLVLEAMAWYPSDYPLCLEQLVLEETRATAYGYRR